MEGTQTGRNERYQTEQRLGHVAMLKGRSRNKRSFALSLALATLGLGAQNCLAAFPRDFDLTTLDGSNGTRFDGAAAFEQGGTVVSLDDINGDGLTDFAVIAADVANANRGDKFYVIFGTKAGFPAQFTLSGLNGTNGFTMSVSSASEALDGRVKAIGDFNADGAKDFVVATRGLLNTPLAGQQFFYVVYGHSGSYPTTLDLSTLNASTGTVLTGYPGFPVAIGDVNGDGNDDVVSANETVGGTLTAAAYVIYGEAQGISKTIDAAGLNGPNGFAIMPPSDARGSYTGFAGSDLNGDNRKDFIIGLPDASPGARNGAGSSFIVFGRSSNFPATLDLNTLDGTTGARVNGVNGLGTRPPNCPDGVGRNVAPLGDLNGDGFGDVAFSAGGLSNISGLAYILFGTNAWSSQIELSGLSGANGFKFAGHAGDGAGSIVGGDINGDGRSDFVVGSILADTSVGALSNAGEVYVVYGQPSSFAFPASVNREQLDGANGFRISGLAANDQAGIVTVLSDTNGDGVQDLLIGAPGADSNGQDSGSSYLIYGQTGTATPVDINPPTVKVTGVAAAARYVLGSVPQAGCETTDELSGVKTPATLKLSGGTPQGVSAFVATCSGAVDNAGNASPDVSVTYDVVFDSSGLLPPIVNAPAFNAAKAGDKIIIPFSLNGRFGLNVLVVDPATFLATPILCPDGTLGTPPPTTATGALRTGSGRLRFNARTKRYNYEWQTLRAFRGGCWQLGISLIDGTEYFAQFKFGR